MGDPVPRDAETGQQDRATELEMPIQIDPDADEKGVCVLTRNAKGAMKRKRPRRCVFCLSVILCPVRIPAETTFCEA